MCKDARSKNRLYSLGIVIILCITVGFDVVPRPYANQLLKNFFTYDFTEVVPIGLAMWAFTTSLFILFFNKRDECYMGITYSELYKEGFDNVNSSIEIWTVGAILVMVLSVFLNFPITLCFCIFFQLMVMIYTLYEMKKLLGHTEMIQLIIKNLNQYLEDGIGQLKDEDVLSDGTQISGGEEVLILKVIKRADLRSIANQEILIKILLNSNVDRLTDDKAFAVGRMLSESFLAADVSKTIRFNLLQQWFLYEKRSVKIKKGILFTLIGQIDYDMLRFLNDLIEQAAPEIRKELVAWYVAVYAIVTKQQGKEEKSVFFADVKRFFQTYTKHFPDSDWEQCAMQEWHKVCNLLGFDAMKDIDVIYKIIKENERRE